jgi:hypothetical protein
MEFKYEMAIKAKDSRDVDLLFTSKDDGRSHIIDIVNLTLDYEKIESESLLCKLLDHRFSEKINNKAFTSTHVKEHYRTASVQPFIWIYHIDTLLNYKLLLSTIRKDHVLPLLCLRQRSDSAGRLFYDCVSIADIES